MLLNRRGFSVVELFTVLVIMAVVMGLSMGKFGAYLAHERVTKAAVGLTDDLRMAFAVPGRVRRPVRVWCDTATMQLLVADRSQTNIYRQTAFGSRYNLKSTNISYNYYPSASWMEIYPNGLASVDSMVISLSSNGYTRSLKVTKGGMVQLR